MAAAQFCVGIVLFRTGEDELHQLLQSVSRQAQDVVDVLLIDNSHGMDGQLEADGEALAMDGLRIRILPSQGNVGFGAAHNMLMAAGFENEANTHYVAANPDGFFFPDSFAKAQRWVQADGLRLLEFRQFPLEHPKTYDARTGRTAWCSGAALVMPRTTFETIGGFDDNIFMYLEDVDLSWRVRMAGGLCVTMHDARYYHDVSDARDSEAVRLEMFRAGRYIAEKWKNPSFRSIMERGLVGEGYADSVQLLPALEVEQMPQEEDDINRIVEFRRLFNFSSSRW